MSLQNKFNTFNQRIYLTRHDDEYTNAREKDDSITATIKAKFKEKGYPVIDNFVQGSLATYTTIKEPGKDFDIDRAIVIDYEESPSDPLVPKKVILEILKIVDFKMLKSKNLVLLLIINLRIYILISQCIERIPGEDMN